MDRSRVAEFVLSCVLPAERAAAVTGDFLEEVEARGQVWFWSSVFRTVASRVLNDFRERPFAMMGVGVAGSIRNGLIMLPAFLAAVWLDGQDRLLVYDASPGAPSHLAVIWQFNWALSILWAVWLFQCGRWAARRVPGFEVASVVSVSAFGWMAILAGWIYLHMFIPGGHINPSVWHDLPVIAGAVVERRLRIA